MLTKNVSMQRQPDSCFWCIWKRGSLFLAAVQAYARKRVLRASTIHGLAGMAAIAASTYKAYLGEGLGPLSWIERFKIPHPGRVCRSHGLAGCFGKMPWNVSHDPTCRRVESCISCLNVS